MSRRAKEPEPHFTFEYEPDGRTVKRFIVVGQKPDGTIGRLGTFVASKRRDAEEFLREQIAAYREHGRGGASLEPHETATVNRWRPTLAQYGVTLEDVIQDWIRLQPKHEGLTVSKIREDYVADRTARRLRTRSLDDVRNLTARFGLDFGDRDVESIAPEEVRDWFRGLQTREGKPVEARTHNNVRRHVLAMFGLAGETYGIESPMRLVKPMKEPEPEAGILTPEQLQALLKAADGEIQCAVALGAFAGLRPSEVFGMGGAEPVAWERVNWESGSIRIPAKSKTQRRIIELGPDATLFAWLRSHRKPEGRIVGSWESCRDRFETARKDAGIVDWPADGLRHSFASHWLPIHHDIGKLSRIMGSSPATLTKHYTSLVTSDVAEKWFAVQPRQ